MFEFYVYETTVGDVWHENREIARHVPKNLYLCTALEGDAGLLLQPSIGG